MEEFPSPFGRYQLLELLATGGMAQIYRASQQSEPGVTKELVIKRVLPHLAHNREFIEMFVDEARITLPLTHGNIVQVFEFGKVGEDYFLAMEFVRGRNVESILERLKQQKQPMPLPVALFIAAEVARGLDYAHRFRDPLDRPSGIIHRDVSPQNILVGFQGEVKLTDFGIAKAKSRIRQTSQGIIRGKACYLSPEQAECLDLDGHSDQFSLGVVLFELLTGRRLLEGENEIASLQKVREARVPPPSSLRSEIPRELDHIVQQSLAKVASDRFGTCAGLASSLDRILSKLGPGFSGEALAQWMRKLYRRDISQEVQTRASTGEHLRHQLGAKGGRKGKVKISTGELLRMGTVSIPKNKANRKKGMPHRSLRVFGFVAAGLFIGLGLTLFFRSGLDGDLVTSPPPTRNEPAQEDRWVMTHELPSPDGGVSDDQDGSAAIGEPAAPETQVPVPASRIGYLNLNSSPWAFVEIDGKRINKETPLFRVPVRIGRHRLRFFNPNLNIERSVVVWVTPKETKTITVRLD